MVMNAANMHPEWYTIPNPTNPTGAPPLFTMPFQANTYQIAGMIDMEGLPGGLKYTSPGLLRAMAGFFAWGLIPPNDTVGKYVIPKFITGSSEVTSLLQDPSFPPFMTVTTHQNYMAPQGAVWAFNQHNGLKKIQLLLGSHGSVFNYDLTNIDELIPAARDFFNECSNYDGTPPEILDADLEYLVCEAITNSLINPEPYDETKDDQAQTFKKVMHEALKNTYKQE
jgi:hypothetical protein